MGPLLAQPLGNQLVIGLGLQFDCHTRNVAKDCNFHTRALRYMRSLLTDDVAQTVACSIVASRLDYCNALLSGALAATFNKLQRTQNNLTRVVCQSRGCTDARPLLHSLHWPPVRHRITYKLAVLSHSHSKPQPLQRMSASWYRPVHHLGLWALPMLRCSSFLAYTSNWPVALFLLLLHPPGTLYLLSFDCAKTFSLSNAKPIYSNSLSPPVLHQVPLCLRT